MSPSPANSLLRQWTGPLTEDLVRAPGDFGFGKKFLDGKTDAQIESMKLKEITHCRAAMLAFSGVVTQSVLFDKGFPYF